MSITDPIYLLYLTTGLTVGFGHCVGMCGPIVVSLSLQLRERSVVLPNILYNAGRITTYALMGAAAGVTGSFTRVTAGIAIVQKSVMIFAGIVIIVMGLAMADWIPSSAIFKDYFNPKGFISKLFRRLADRGSTARYYPLGLVLGLLPCGPVYTGLIGAARAGMEARSTLEGLISGACLMLAFGVGTMPALVLVARLANIGWLKKRDFIYRIGSILMIALGGYFVVRGIRY